MRKLSKSLKEKEILWRRIIVFTLALVFLVLYFPQILQILAALVWICLPFIIGGIIAFVLNTLTRVIIRYCKRAISFNLTRKGEIYFKILSLFIVITVVIFIFYSIVPQLLNSIERLINNVPIVVSDFYNLLLEWASNYPVLSDWLIENSQYFLNVSTYLPTLVNFITTGGFGEAVNQIGTALSGTFNWIWVVFISVMFSIIAFFNTSRILTESKMVAMAYLSVEQYTVLKHVAIKTARIFSQYLGGTLLECLILATLVTIINTLLNIPYPLLIGFVCGISALVPMFGATIAALICAFFLSVINPVKGITFLIAFLLLQQVEGNFIYPNVVGKSVGLPSVYVLIAITIGAGIAGILGIILSIPLTTVLYELLKEDALKRINQKEYPQQEKDQFLDEKVREE